MLRGLTYTTLSSRTWEAGRLIPASALRRIEHREREVSVDELGVLALALDASPVDLMAPTISTTNTIPIRMRAGDIEMSAVDFRRWVRGDGMFAAEVPEPGMLDVFQMLIFGLGSTRASSLLTDWLVTEALVPRPGETQVDAFRRVSELLATLVTAV
jgi:hypothetical protein